MLLGSVLHLETPRLPAFSTRKRNKLCKHKYGENSWGIFLKINIYLNQFCLKCCNRGFWVILVLALYPCNYHTPLHVRDPYLKWTFLVILILSIKYNVNIRGALHQVRALNSNVLWTGGGLPGLFEPSLPGIKSRIVCMESMCSTAKLWPFYLPVEDTEALLHAH